MMVIISIDEGHHWHWW